MNLITASLTLFVSLTVSQDPVAKPALRGLDPVALCEGKEVPGSERWTAGAAGLVYRFSSEENRTKFLKDPERWGIQFDGACMKMGPTSGKGSSDRFAVHEGRIYVFASDACYQWFVLDPERFIDRPDRWEEPTADQVRRAKGLLDSAVARIGGADRLRRASILQFRYDVVEAARRGEIRHSVITTYRDPGAIRRDYVYPGYAWSLLSLPKAGYVLMKEVEKTGRDTQAYMLRSVSHEPLYLLREAVLGRAKFAWQGTSIDREGAFGRVRLYSGGAVTVLSIDQVSGIIRSAEYVGRSGPGIARVVNRYSAEGDLAGLRVPREVRTVFGGLPEKETITLLADLRLDPSLPAGFFEPRPLQ
ncbi:MAG TPA: hypothetical protein PLL78_00955 [Fimbriimonadaceae bacterium]|nr:hypothetical protein [Fimbriimonadaceae bacterium]HRJ95231.1 hypothetical protein [Fimbriimonadaceae bacterium]